MELIKNSTGLLFLNFNHIEQDKITNYILGRLNGYGKREDAQDIFSEARVILYTKFATCDKSITEFKKIFSGILKIKVNEFVRKTMDKRVLERLMFINEDGETEDFPQNNDYIVWKVSLPSLEYAKKLKRKWIATPRGKALNLKHKKDYRNKNKLKVAQAHKKYLENLKNDPVRWQKHLEKMREYQRNFQLKKLSV